ncbi:MAG: hypothetical protein ABI652_04075 [Acidobacteriota bacterium]
MDSTPSPHDRRNTDRPMSGFLQELTRQNGHVAEVMAARSELLSALTLVQRSTERLKVAIRKAEGR